jgi:hypothetical protein
MFGLFKKALSSCLPFIGRNKENTESEPEKPIEECGFNTSKYWQERHTYDEFLMFNDILFTDFSDIQIISFGLELIEKWGMEPGYAMGMVARLLMKKYSNNEAHQGDYYLNVMIDSRRRTCRQLGCDNDLSTPPKCFCNDPTQRYKSFVEARANGEIEMVYK